MLKLLVFLSGGIVAFLLAALFLRQEPAAIRTTGVRQEEPQGVLRELGADVGIYQDGVQIGALKAGTLLLHTVRVEGHERFRIFLIRNAEDAALFVPETDKKAPFALIKRVNAGQADRVPYPTPLPAPTPVSPVDSSAFAPNVRTPDDSGMPQMLFGNGETPALPPADSPPTTRLSDPVDAIAAVSSPTESPGETGTEIFPTPLTQTIPATFPTGMAPPKFAPTPTILASLTPAVPLPTDSPAAELSPTVVPTPLLTPTLTPTPTPAPANSRLFLERRTATPGETVTFNCMLAHGVIPCAGLRAGIQFPEGVTVRNVSGGGLLAGGFTIDFHAVTEYRITVVAYSGSSTFSGDGVLLTMTITIAPDMPPGKYPVMFLTSELSDRDGIGVAHTRSDGLIEILANTPTPKPTATPSATPTPTPTPTPTLEPTETPTSLPTVTPTSVPTPAPTPVFTVTPEPTATATPTATPTGAIVLWPTATPEPTATATPDPTSTPMPTATPEPTATPLPTATMTPMPTALPTPTATVTPLPTMTPMPTITPTATATPILPFCRSVTEIPQSECQTLLSFYTNTDGPNWLNTAGWLQTSTPCSWYGVECESGHVTELNLYSNNLTGPLAPELVNLTQLKILWLYENYLSGSIFPGVGSLTNLQQVWLSNNQLTGNIPPEFGNLPYLNVLDLSYNQLDGPVPDEFGNLDELYLLYLDHNTQLNGPLPLSLMNLMLLQAFKYSNTNLCEPPDSLFQTWLAGLLLVEGTGVLCPGWPTPTPTPTPTATPTGPIPTPTPTMTPTVTPTPTPTPTGPTPTPAPTATPTPALFADLNGDGVVDSEDMKIVLDCIQGKGPCDGCDLNLDGVVDIIDFLLVVKNKT